jgi:hypothetical protein
MRYFVLSFTLAGLLILIGCGSSKPSSDNDEGGGNTSCVEPQNPYDEGTGHYAGYKWAEEKGSGTCSSSSESFKEGCEEYESQESKYQNCLARKKR